MNLLTQEETATLLGISKASLKNWEKQGYIKPLHNNRYSELEVEDLKDKIKRKEIKKLDSRANKSSSLNCFIPVEYVNNKDSVKPIEEVVNFVLQYNIKPEQALFLLSVNILAKAGDIQKDQIYEALKFKDKSLFKRKSVYNQLKTWYEDIRTGEIKEDNRFCSFLLNAELPSELDLLGLIYQSITHEGKKSKLGSYYTPTTLVKEIVEENELNGKVLDPCCGTGQFLLVMADKVADPLNIWGADIDKIAVRITRINILLHYKDIDFKPNIFYTNSLLDFKEKEFSFIGTNPPWGAKFSKNDLKLIKKLYPNIESSESFSFFLIFALDKLKDGGSFSYVLPESILYVKSHQDIRKYLLNNSEIKKIESCGRLFKNVFSSVIRLDAKKSLHNNQSQILIEVNGSKYHTNQDRYLSNVNSIIDIYCKREDYEIIDKVYSHPHTTLKNNATWALGIVTGNNDKYVSQIYKDGMEPLYKGKDVNKLYLNPETSYIKFNPEDYQQCAPVEIYRAEEKLIYKFINKNLVFAYDNNQQLTLNSANILIPQLESVPVKVIGALFNSTLYNFIFNKKFNAVKILRSDIEELPIPILSEDEINGLVKLIDEYLTTGLDFRIIDEFILEIFNIDRNMFKKILEK